MGAGQTRSAVYFRTLLLQNRVILKSGIPGQGSGDVQKMERSWIFSSLAQKKTFSEGSSAGTFTFSSATPPWAPFLSGVCVGRNLG